MEQRYFEDVELGDEFEEEITPTLEDVRQYQSLQIGPPREGAPRGRGGPPDGRFDSKEGARSVGLEGPIVPGSMSFSIMSRLVSDWAGVQGRMQTLDISYRRPVQQGDHLRLGSVVTDTTEDEQGARAILDVYMENERGERPVQGTAVVELPHRPQ